LLTRTGERERGKEIAAQLGSGEAYGAPLGLAIFHICCGEIDRAAEWSERAIEQRDSLAPSFLHTSIGEPLRSSPLWGRLAALMSLPASAPGS
jgi:hypothetical protein